MSDTQAMAQPLPWHEAQWSRLVAAHTGDSLPHALLLCGVSGIGKRPFALALAELLLCEQPQHGRACGVCRQCALSRAGTHPDLRQLQPQESGMRLKIDQVRELVDFLAQTAQQGGYRVALLYPADSMNLNAANALLKSLEEPGAKTLLLLITDSPARLLPTIRSRCQQVVLPLPEQEQALAWMEGQGVGADCHQLLQEAEGRPLAARELALADGLEQRRQWASGFLAMAQGRESPLRLAEQWLEYDMLELLVWLQGKLTALISYSMASRELEESWQPLASGIDLKRLFALSDSLLLLHNQLSTGANPNKQLALEEIMLESCDIFTTSRHS